VRTYLTLRVNPQTHVLLGLPAASGALIVPTMASRRPSTSPPGARWATHSAGSVTRGRRPAGKGRLS